LPSSPKYVVFLLDLFHRYIVFPKNVVLPQVCRDRQEDGPPAGRPSCSYSRRNVVILRKIVLFRRFVKIRTR
jgi:hypothetical protein